MLGCSRGRVAALVLASLITTQASAQTNLGHLNVLVIGVFLEGESQIFGDGQWLSETAEFEVVTAATLSDVDEYMDRVSYHRTRFVGEFTGPYDVGSGICAISGVGPRLQEMYARALDQAKLDVDLTFFDRVVFVHPSIAGCVQGSSSAVVDYDLGGNLITLHGIHSTSFYRTTWIHEFGHSFGNVVGDLISHIELLDCQDTMGGFEIISDDCQGKYNLFNSMYDPMGLLTPSHFSTLNKQKIGWLEDDDFQVAVDGVFDVRALEAGRGGHLALKVPLPGYPYELHVEYREPEPPPPYADPTYYPIPGVVIHARGVNTRHYNVRAEEAFYIEDGLLHLTGPIVQNTVYAFGDTGIALELLATNGQSASIRLTAQLPSQTQCNDGIDNDGDGDVDAQDERCSIDGSYDPSWLSEFSPRGASEVPAVPARGLLALIVLLTGLAAWMRIAAQRA